MSTPKKNGLYMATHIETGHRVVVNVVLDGHPDAPFAETFVYGDFESIVNKLTTAMPSLSAFKDWDVIPGVTLRFAGELVEPTLGDLPYGFYRDLVNGNRIAKSRNAAMILCYEGVSGRGRFLDEPQTIDLGLPASRFRSIHSLEAHKYDEGED